MKICDVCGAPLGLLKFRCEDGVVCKACYEKASEQCTGTICHQTLEEVKNRCDQRPEKQVSGDFETTRRVANYILFDDKHQKICIPNNRAIVKKYYPPEMYPYRDIQSAVLRTEPSFTIHELDEWDGSRTSKMIRSMGIEMKIKGKDKPVMLPVVNSAVRTKSYAFHRSYIFAKRIITALEKIKAK